MKLSKRTKRIVGLTSMTFVALFVILMFWSLAYPVTMSLAMAMEGETPVFTVTVLKLGITYLGVISTGVVLVAFGKTIRRQDNVGSS